MALQFQPYPIPPEERQRENPVASAANGLQNTLALFLQFKNQQDALQAQRESGLVNLAKATEEGGQDFWNNYQALRSGKNPYGTAIPAATPAPTPGAALPAGPMQTPVPPKDNYSQYSSIQDPLGTLPYMSPAQPAGAPPQMSMATPASAATPAPSGPSKTLDITPEYLASIRKQKGSKGLKEFEDQQTFLMNQKQGTATLSGGLRDDYSKATLPFQTQSENMAKLDAIRKMPGTPASDVALMAAYMRVIDPGAMVKEGQYARLEDTAGIPDKIRDIYNSLVEGKSLKSLTQTQRDQFFNAAANVYQGSNDRYKQTADVYTGMATRQGLNPQDVVVPYGFQGFDMANYSRPSAPTAMGGAPPPRAAAPTAAPKQFASVGQAEQAGLPKGTIVMIGGRRAVIE